MRRFMAVVATATVMLACLVAAVPAGASTPASRYKAMLSRVMLDCWRYAGCSSVRVDIRPTVVAMGFTPFDTNYEHYWTYRTRRWNCEGIVRYEERGGRPDSTRIVNKLCGGA